MICALVDVFCGILNMAFYYVAECKFVVSTPIYTFNLVQHCNIL